MDGSSLKATVYFIAVVLSVAWVVTKIPNQPIMYDRTPICKVGTPTVKNSMVVCVVNRD